MANKSTATFSETFRVHQKVGHLVREAENTETLNAMQGIWGSAELTTV
jgi:hypothetical protein